MIGYLKGKIISIEKNVIILETNGVGFEVNCSSSVINNLSLNAVGEVYVYTAVKEDGIFLYGFIDKAEKGMFLKLISISGVGPKMAITILSGMSQNELALKIATSDVKGLSTIKGLGKKTAERIILELREKVEILEDSKGEDNLNTNNLVKSDESDAVIALLSLGFSRNECEKSILDARNNGAKSINELISFALKSMR